MGFGPVPYGAIVRYAEWNNLTEFTTLLRCIREMDAVWLEIAVQESKGYKVENRELSLEEFDAILGA